MKIFSTAGQVSKAFRNAGRAREIVSAMSRFGFGALVERLGLRSFRSSSSTEPEASEALPLRLRKLLESLGPTFIKIGQTLAERPDLVSKEIVEEFEKLQDHVEPLPFNTLKPVLEQSLGRPLSACFASFDTEALASASIAQVHAARTLQGEDVVVKIQKPEVEKILKQDLEIVESLAQLCERYISELRPFRPVAIVNEFKRALLLETDFKREASNISRFRKNFAHNNFLAIPRVYEDLSSSSVITMERLRGVRLQNIDKVQAMGVNPKDLLSKGMDAFLESILVHGLFHGDPHGGNILALPDGRMGLIDFGSVGWLSQKSKDALINMFLGLLEQDYEALVREYMQLSPEEGSRSSRQSERLQNEIAALFTPYHGLPLSEVPTGRLLFEGTSVAFKNRISLPPDLVLVFRSIMILEGIARTLDPHFDMVSAGFKFAKIALRERYAPERVLRDALITGRDWAGFFKISPRKLSEILKQIENGDFKMHLKIDHFDRLAQAKIQSANKISFAIVSSAFIFVAGMGLVFGSAHVAIQGVLSVLAIVLGVSAVLRSLR